MKPENYSKTIYCGKSRRKLQTIALSLGGISKLDEYIYSFEVTIDGPNISENRKLQASSEFDCLTMGTAFFRQSLRLYLINEPKIKFYEKVHEDEFLNLSLDEIFGTMDCIPEDLQIAYEWAKNNGYESI